MSKKGSSGISGICSICLGFPLQLDPGACQGPSRGAIEKAAQNLKKIKKVLLLFTCDHLQAKSLNTVGKANMCERESQLVDKTTSIALH